MEVKAKIIKIGPNAISKKDPMVILFDETATDTLEEVAVIQQFLDKSEEAQVKLAVGDEIQIGASNFTIQKVGALVQSNLTSIGHATLIFKTPEAADQMQSAIYLTNSAQEVPTFDLNTVITYRF
ncbi:PTS glucitol/sorbitol transporter subunit IIA [Agrilactobacillus yilanensis]|uniref:PTS glucitol/sorbitol transporter subunit IIA n=1 Tax=Agrilactobacillus yilanensis TaxID=2485997 RepID=A0ABW4JBB5_9LACO|nr:PTS glucitol/sorbitol transporter subunit IIA [Agrilactobacillus yilanensis]